MKGKYTMIKKMIDKFKAQKGSVSFDGASLDSIKEVDTFFLQNNFSDIPDDYKSFLEYTNGLIYNGIEFFGTQFHHREERNYYFPDIVTINKHYKKYTFFEQKIIIGRLSESIILYDKKAGYFAIVDRIKLRSRTEYEDMEELLEFLMGACINPSI